VAGMNVNVSDVVDLSDRDVPLDQLAPIEVA
jgi:hypothetical protein